MQYKTHVALSITIGIAALDFFPSMEPELLLYSGGLILGGLLPDIDHMRSKIGRVLPILSKIINGLFGHRAFFHSLLFIALLSIILRDLTPVSFVYGLLIGTASHLLGDMMTHRGIKLLYPIPWNIRFPLTFKTGGRIEHLSLILFIGVSIWYGKLLFLS